MIDSVGDARAVGLAVVAVVALQRLAELVLARRNTERLLAEGAVEHGRDHYPFMVALHVAWLAACGYAAFRTEAIHVLPLAIFILMQFARVWVISALGPYWTTRIITVPGAPLVRRGPYRFMAHPNYVVVTAEILLLPLVFEAYWTAGLFTLLNAAMLRVRIRAENAALEDRRQYHPE